MKIQLLSYKGTVLGHKVVNWKRPKAYLAWDGKIYAKVYAKFNASGGPVYQRISAYPIYGVAYWKVVK